MEHKHATILRAIADGKEIQGSYRTGGAWWPSDLEEFAKWADDPAFQFRVKPERISGWINVYSSGVIGDLYDTKEDADLNADFGRIACIPVEFDEGDGL